MAALFLLLVSGAVALIPSLGHLWIHKKANFKSFLKVFLIWWAIATSLYTLVQLI